jgi:hypothetical protein
MALESILFMKLELTAYWLVLILNKKLFCCLMTVIYQNAYLLVKYNVQEIYLPTNRNSVISCEYITLHNMQIQVSSYALFAIHECGKLFESVYPKRYYLSISYRLT